MYSVVIADDEPIVRMHIEELLSNNGYEVVGSVGDGYDAIELCRRVHPDFVILDVNMPIINGLEAAKTINNEKLAGFILILTAYKDKNIAHRATEAEVMGYVVKPVDEGSLIPAIEIAIAKHKEFEKLSQERDKAKIALEERKYVDKAKHIIMEKNSLCEDDAYSYIRKIAMDKGCRIGDIAKIIIKSEEFNK